MEWWNWSGSGLMARTRLKKESCLIKIQLTKFHLCVCHSKSHCIVLFLLCCAVMVFISLYSIHFVFINNENLPVNSRSKYREQDIRGEKSYRENFYKKFSSNGFFIYFFLWVSPRAQTWRTIRDYVDRVSAAGGTASEANRGRPLIVAGVVTNKKCNWFGMMTLRD